MDIADIGVKCPRCGILFNTKQIPVIYDSGMRDSELRHKNNSNAGFEHFVVCTCPSCGKSDWTAGFEVVEEKAQVYQQPLAAHLQFRTAAIEAERGGSNWFNIGMLYLHAAWCADDEHAVSQASEYRHLAAEALQKSLSDHSCPANQINEIEYLIGELFRRCGEFNACQEYFKRNIARLSSPYALMARKLMRLAEYNDLRAVAFEA